MIAVVLVPSTPDGASVSGAMDMALEQARAVASLAEDGRGLVLVPTRGGMLDLSLLRAEVIEDFPLDVSLAESQAAQGYVLETAVANEFKVRGITRGVATILTRVVVDVGDAAFLDPSFAVGPLMEESQARSREDVDGWDVGEQPEGGWRRLVPSARPVEVVEADAIRTLASAGTVVVAAGGGIPVVKDERGLLMGVAAVVDEAAFAALLAKRLEGEVVDL